MARQPRRGNFEFRRQINRTRRLLKRLPEGVRTEVLELYQREGPALASASRAAAPRKTGALARAISFRINPRGLNLRVGLLGKLLNRTFFYARILENGRRAGTSRVIKRRLRNGGQSKPYTIRVSPIPRDRYDFIKGRFAQQALRDLGPKLRTIWTRALRRAVSES